MAKSHGAIRTVCSLLLAAYLKTTRAIIIAGMALGIACGYVLPVSSTPPDQQR